MVGKGGAASASVYLRITDPRTSTVTNAKCATGLYPTTVWEAIVTADTEQIPGCFYIQSLDAPVGIRVVGRRLQVKCGDIVRVTGRVYTTDGERLLRATDVTMLSHGNPIPAPIGMANRSIGGGDFGPDPSAGAGQNGITRAYGLNNIGMLVRTWGTVTQIGNGYLYIDDGSHITDGTYTGAEENIGIRVICNPNPEWIGRFVAAIGISSCFQPTAGQFARRIITRSQSDIFEPGG